MSYAYSPSALGAVLSTTSVKRPTVRIAAHDGPSRDTGMPNVASPILYPQATDVAAACPKRQLGEDCTCSMHSTRESDPLAHPATTESSAQRSVAGGHPHDRHTTEASLRLRSVDDVGCDRDRHPDYGRFTQNEPPSLVSLTSVLSAAPSELPPSDLLHHWDRWMSTLTPPLPSPRPHSPACHTPSDRHSVWDGLPQPRGTAHDDPVSCQVEGFANEAPRRSLQSGKQTHATPTRPTSGVPRQSPDPSRPGGPGPNRTRHAPRPTSAFEGCYPPLEEHPHTPRGHPHRGPTPQGPARPGPRTGSGAATSPHRWRSGDSEGEPEKENTAPAHGAKPRAKPGASFYDRAMTWKHVTKHKEHQKRVELQEQELSTCTFRPRVNAPAAPRPQPTLRAFGARLHNDAVLKEHNARQRSRELASDSLKDCTFSPKLCRNAWTDYVSPRYLSSGTPSADAAVLEGPGKAGAEDAQCTFQPKVNRCSKQHSKSLYLSTNAFDRLSTPRQPPPPKPEIYTAETVPSTAMSQGATGPGACTPTSTPAPSTPPKRRAAGPHGTPPCARAQRECESRQPDRDWQGFLQRASALECRRKADQDKALAEEQALMRSPQICAKSQEIVGGKNRAFLDRMAEVCPWGRGGG